MTLFSTLRTTAQGLIEDFGDSLTLTKVIQNQYHPAVGRGSEVDGHSYTFSAVIDSLGPGHKLSDRFSIVAGDLSLTVVQGELEVDFDPHDKILIGEDVWRVIAIDPPHSQDSVVVRTVQLRRGDS